MKCVQIYTDGSCFPNPGPGGWGAVLIHVGKDNEVYRREVSGPLMSTTNSRAEMLSAIHALSVLKYPCDVVLHSDSQYLIRAFTHGWLQNWQRWGWKGNTVKNKDLWLELLALDKIHKITWTWVKGHAGNPGNERADILAGQQRLVAIEHGRQEKTPGSDSVFQVCERGRQ